jgi:prophage DNA circulation protein
MPDILSTLPKASFSGIAFPFTKISIRGGLRHHVHTYLHQPGGAIEDLGRKPYEVHFACEFHTTMRVWVNAYPELLTSLLDAFELGATASLSIPNVGTIQAKAIQWTHDLSAKILSGESAEFTFLEDSSNQLLAQSAVTFSMAAVPVQAAVLSDVAAQYGVNASLLDDLLGFVSDLQAIHDQVELEAQLIAMKADQIMDACATLESLVNFNDSTNYPVLDALRDVWMSAFTVSLDALQQSLPLDSYFVPRTMTVTEVSLAIYSDTAHAVELLQLNAFADALAIKPGTIVNHYAVLPSAA